jgi:glycosyltransferase involved in cell wall biosynthesis
MRAIALLATYNEERFAGPCIEHALEQGLDVYLIDNDSTDGTVQIAERYLGRGLIGIERLSRNDMYSWRPLLARKEELARSLDADGFLHIDADEIRPSPRRGVTVAEALAEVGRRGFNAVNFQEFTFVPTREAPDHDHPRFYETMRRYYPFQPRHPDQVRAWKRQETPVDLVATGGHRAEFAGLRLYPESFPMRHYLFLSRQHAIRKYCSRRYDPAEVAAGWHRARAELRPEDVTLLSQSELRLYTSDTELDASNPWTRHPLFGASACAT